MSSYGYSIVQVLVTDILPDQKVRNAMNEINAASRLRYWTTPCSSKLNLSLGIVQCQLLAVCDSMLTGCALWCRVAAVEKAEAAKINVVKAAEADAEAKFLQGQVGAPKGRNETLQSCISKQTHVQLRLSVCVEATRQRFCPSGGCVPWLRSWCGVLTPLRFSSCAGYRTAAAGDCQWPAGECGTVLRAGQRHLQVSGLQFMVYEAHAMAGIAAARCQLCFAAASRELLPFMAIDMTHPCCAATTCSRYCLSPSKFAS